MATIPNPPTFGVLSPLTAGQMNGFRDYINFLVAPPLCVLTNSAAITLPTTTQLALTFDTEGIDSDGMHSLSTNTSRITCVTPGWYDVTGMASFSANPAGSRFGSFVINGSALDLARIEVAADQSTSRSTSLVTTTPIYLSVGDYVEFTVWQNLTGGGSSLTIDRTRFSARWIHS